MQWSSKRSELTTCVAKNRSSGLYDDVTHFQDTEFPSLPTCSFELSVPGHALIATPNHGAVASLSSLTVSVAVNKAALLQGVNDGANPALPWTGSLYVNGDDGATVAVKVTG